jgi:hypothetical protein
MSQPWTREFFKNSKNHAIEAYRTKCHNFATKLDTTQLYVCIEFPAMSLITLRGCKQSYTQYHSYINVPVPSYDENSALHVRFCDLCMCKVSKSQCLRCYYSAECITYKQDPDFNICPLCAAMINDVALYHYVIKYMFLSHVIHNMDIVWLIGLQLAQLMPSFRYAPNKYVYIDEAHQIAHTLETLVQSNESIVWHVDLATYERLRETSDYTTDITCCHINPREFTWTCSESQLVMSLCENGAQIIIRPYPQ